MEQHLVTTTEPQRVMLHEEGMVDPYMPCIYRPNMPCIWVAGCSFSGGCMACPVSHAMGVHGVMYAYAPKPVKLKTELICSSPCQSLGDYEQQLLDELELPNWSVRFSEMCRYFEDWLRKEKKLKRVTPDYFEALDMVLANLVSMDNQSQLLVSKKKVTELRRNPQSLGYSIVQKVLEYLESRRLIWVMKGKDNSFDNAGTWCMPSKRLLDDLAEHEITPQIHPDTLLLDYKEWVEIKTKNKKEKWGWKTASLPSEWRPKSLELHMPALNHTHLWEHHTATLDGQRIVPHVWRVFNGSLEHGGRFYGTYMNMKKEDRARVLIGGEATVEPDFTAFHVAILYAQNGLQMNGDPYRIEPYDRDTIKSVILRMLNSKSSSGFAGQITKSGNPNTKANWIRYQNTTEQARQSGLQTYSLPNNLKGFIENIPDHQDGATLMRAIKAHHPDIAHEFFSKDLGLKLQFQDSQIMGAILEELSSRGIPTLPVHDSLRCKESDKDVVIEVMQSKYREVMCRTSDLI